jgi:micrococcal nuclease
MLIYMPVLLVATALCLSPSVHDGDTIRCGRERVRIANIDAPELADSPKCQDRRRSYAWCDFQAGEASRIALGRLLARGQVMIERLGTDPYGRTLATISVNGIDAGDYLISQGLAKPWR